ncbi:MAG: hypothetical protein HY776_09010 [Actinobacteria bacterium]|nr:hypothetical protein [Actinomycetota bacterium]
MEKLEKKQLLANLVLVIILWWCIGGLIRILEEASLVKNILTELGAKIPFISLFFYKLGAFSRRYHTLIFWTYTIVIFTWIMSYLVLWRPLKTLPSLRFAIITSVAIVVISILLAVIIWFFSWWWPLREAMKINY